MKNTSIPLGGILLIDKVEKSFDIFSEIFSGVGGKAKDFIGCVKLHLYNNDSFRFHSSDTRIRKLHYHYLTLKPEFLLARDKGLAKLFREKHESLKRFLEDKDEIAQPSFIEEFLKYWKEYAIFGGYPEVIKAKDKEEKITILRNIYNLYLEKDVIGFFRVEETSKFEDLLKAFAFNISSLLVLSSLASDLKISYRKAEEFLNILQHSYIIYLLKPFHKNLVTELRKARKLYFLDLGLRNSAINNFVEFDNRDDRGKLMENFVLRELLTNFESYELKYWRTTGKAEIDFILIKDENVIPAEVKLSGERLSKGFYSFLNAYKPERAIIITLDKFKKQKIEKTLVYWIPVFYF